MQNEKPTPVRSTQKNGSKFISNSIPTLLFSANHPKRRLKPKERNRSYSGSMDRTLSNIQPKFSDDFGLGPARLAFHTHPLTKCNLVKKSPAVLSSSRMALGTQPLSFNFQSKELSIKTLGRNKNPLLAARLGLILGVCSL